MEPNLLPEKQVGVVAKNTFFHYIFLINYADNLNSSDLTTLMYATVTSIVKHLYEELLLTTTWKPQLMQNAQTISLCILM